MTSAAATDARTAKGSDLFRQKAFVGGRWSESPSGRVMTIDDPATGEIIGTVPDLGAPETRAAIEAANAAMPAWRSRTAKERAAVLRRWFDLMMARREELAAIMTLEQGKPLAESRGEIAYAAAFLEWFGEESKRVYGDVIPSHGADKRIVVLKQPIGVCAAITPWNFPAAMITRKVGPALAAGCAMVVKPSPQTPFSALALCALGEEAGVPLGVLSCVTGADAAGIGREMTTNPLVRKFSFTGSTQTGRLLLEQCASTVKKTSMELGGNAPFIVFDDADLEAAVAGAIASKYRNAGQTCVCANRIFVQDGIFDAFVEKLADSVGRMKVANGFEPQAQIGPLIETKALDKVKAHVSDARDKGGRVVLGGAQHQLGGLFYEPTIIAGATPDMRLFREETFGPVAPIFRFSDEKEAIGLANDTEFGLAAYFYGRDVARVWRVAEALDYGIVGINEGIISTEVAPFGGVKQSGLGREGSKYGIEDYVEIKYLCFGGLA